MAAKVSKVKLTSTGEPTATADGYRRVLEFLRDNTKLSRWQTWVTLLECQYEMPEHRITATQMAKHAYLKSYSKANLEYGGLAHAVADRLEYKPPKCDSRPRWWMALSSGNLSQAEDGHVEFTMRLALAEALEQLGWVRAATKA